LTLILHFFVKVIFVVSLFESGSQKGKQKINFAQDCGQISKTI